MVTKEIRNPSPVDELYERLWRDLTEKDLPPGTRLQPIRKLAQSYNVSYLVAQRALKRLQDNGLVKSRQGDGIYIAGQGEPPAHTPAARLPHTVRRHHVDPTTGRRVYNLGIVMPYWSSKYGGIATHTLVKGILGQADPHGWRVELVHNVRHEACQAAFVDKVLSKGFDGVVWLQPVPEHQMNLMRLIDRGLEVVATGRRFPDIPLPVVREDQTDLAEKVAAACRPEQHHIAVLTCPYEGRMADPYCADFISEFHRALERRGRTLSTDHILQYHWTARNEAFLRLFLEQQGPFDAFVLLHSDILELFDKLESKNWWPAPEQLTLIDIAGEYNHTRPQVGRIPLQIVRHPLENIGRAAVRLFEEKWLGQTTGPEPELAVTMGRHQ